MPVPVGNMIDNRAPAGYNYPMKNLGTQELKTERLTLRAFRVSDAEEMFANWANDPEVTKYLTWQPHGDVSVTRQLLALWEEEAKKPETYNWAMVHEGELIGNVSILNVNDFQEKGTLGYCMAKKRWGKGLMSEAVKEVLRFCFEEVGFARVSGEYAAPNIGSGRVQEKCGLSYEGTRRKFFRLPSTGERVDIVMRGITKEDYFSRK